MYIVITTHDSALGPPSSNSEVLSRPRHCDSTSVAVNVARAVLWLGNVLVLRKLDKLLLHHAPYSLILNNLGQRPNLRPRRHPNYRHSKRCCSANQRHERKIAHLQHAQPPPKYICFVRFAKVTPPKTNPRNPASDFGLSEYILEYSGKKP
jgi:hypothetical protein